MGNRLCKASQDMRSPKGAWKEEMEREITPAEADWAYAKVLELFELVARGLAKNGHPELAAELRAWR